MMEFCIPAARGGHHLLSGRAADGAQLFRGGAALERMENQAWLQLNSFGKSRLSQEEVKDEKC